MRRIVVSEFMSVDGVMEDPGGAEGYEYGGWSRPDWSEELGKVKHDRLKPAANHAVSTAVDKAGFSNSFSGWSGERC